MIMMMRKNDEADEEMRSRQETNKLLLCKIQVMKAGKGKENTSAHSVHKAVLLMINISHLFCYVNGCTCKYRKKLTGRKQPFSIHHQLPWTSLIKPISYPH